MRKKKESQLGFFYKVCESNGGSKILYNKLNLVIEIRFALTIRINIVFFSLDSILALI